MIFIADYCAIGIVIALLLFYYEKQRYLEKTDKIFIGCLYLSLISSVVDIVAGQVMNLPSAPLWINVGINSLYFLTTILTTSCIALFLFHKILEHVLDSHCMKYACCGLTIFLSIFLFFIITNIWTGWLFYFDQNGTYQRGPLNALGYYIVLCQMILVIICYYRNYKNATKTMKRIVIQIFPIVALCFIIQRVNQEIMMNGIIMAMVDTVLFLTFQGQRPGIHNLTKLNDRYRFFRTLEEFIDKHQKFHVFLINIKNFGIINQKYGHLTGNEILYQFAFSLEKLLSNSNAFHMNGTVFALTMPYTSQSEEEVRCGTLLDFLDNKVIFKNEHLRFDYVVVEYISDEKDSDAAEFYEKLEYAANTAYQSKNRYIRYSEDLGNKMNRNRYLIERMQTIDKEHGYQVWFQPIHCIGNQKFCSMEALLRLQEPDGTMISPAEFIPVAEQVGLINPITWFVIDEVCSFLSSHRQMDWVSVSINLPMAQLFEKGFITRLNGIVDSYHIQHSRICLEFTERAILENFDKTKNIMEQLTEDGYRFFLDDFGIGYSNFNCLLQLPFHSIKLDASLNPYFVKTKTSNTALIHTLTTLFHNMNLKVIAEGAETAESVTYLKNQGVDKIQGYYFAKPMNQEKLLEFYENSK